jgi:hypothetical protein
MRVFPIGSYYFVLKTTPSLPSSPSTFSFLSRIEKERAEQMSETIYERLDRLQLAEVAPAAPEDVDALTHLQAIYRDPQHPPASRMRAAIAALAFERPKLSVSARVSHVGMADRMEAVARQLAPQSTAVTIEARRVEDGG